MTSEQKNNLLIIIGVGASLAEQNFFGQRFYPTIKFFQEYEILKDEHPHLFEMINIINCQNFSEWDHSLTQGWIILDTLKKYILRYKKYDNDLYHARLEKNKEYPGYKILDRFEDIARIYFNSSRRFYINSCAYKFINKIKGLELKDAILTFAYFELMDLLIFRYSYPSIISEKNFNTISPYKALISYLNTTNKWDNIFVVNLNYDMIFELSYQNFGNDFLPLFFIRDLHEFKKLYLMNSNKILMCKPHGGFNLKHDSLTANINIPSNPYEGFTRKIFRYDFTNLLEPYFIPYFSEPDEFNQQHSYAFRNVAKYFNNQHKILIEMLIKSVQILSIGYSYPETDAHLFNSRNFSKSINIYDIDIEADRNKEKEIQKIFKSAEVELYKQGFTEESVNNFVNKINS